VGARKDKILSYFIHPSKLNFTVKYVVVVFALKHVTNKTSKFLMAVTLHASFQMFIIRHFKIPFLKTSY
jgi:hypothetical protein